MVMISLSASPAWGPRFLAGWASWLSSRASQCGPKAWPKSSNWQKPSKSRSNMDASPHLMAPTQKEELKGDKGLASPQTRNSGYKGPPSLSINEHWNYVDRHPTKVFDGYYLFYSQGPLPLEW